MKIIYVHHAYRDKGNPPSQEDGIKEIGRKDAEIVSNLLYDLHNKQNIEAIYSSPFLRCMETARIINTYIKAPIIHEPRLNEFKSFYANDNLQFDYSKETWVECQIRIRNAIKDIVEKFDDNSCVVCVTSGVNIAGFLSLVYHLQPDEQAPFLQIPSCSTIAFDIDKQCFS